ncbi:hypothetical protein, partial [Salmonella enterica]|uniref:hypothetical protein n=1 Tax=Salmonella enterica TaxID=28901 RepID=UPI0020C318E1
DFWKCWVVVVPRHGGRMRNKFFFSVELHGLFEFVGFHLLFFDMALELAFYGGEQNLVSIYMSEFKEDQTVSTLIGAPT